MKKKEKRALLLLVLVAVIIIAIIWAVTRGGKEEVPEGGSVQVGTGTTNAEYVKEEKDGTKVNTSDKVKEDRELDGIKINDIRLEEKNGQTQLVATLTNTTGKKVDRFLIDFVLYDNAGNEIVRIPGIIGEMKAGETIQTQAGITEDYVGAYDFKIVKK